MPATHPPRCTATCKKRADDKKVVCVNGQRHRAQFRDDDSGSFVDSDTARYSIGALSQVIQTELGFHILRVEQRQPLPLSAVKAVIANELAHRDAEALLLNGYKLNDAYFAQ